ncbi:hypothetical protein CkaCkLH20_01367 [Colletotrichum karsti]|uniref:Reverse transcriptase domain-containing protein n=1 Tax=Colletotrichum karsti TaxID=1095194 RepID=A0A9P6ID47_9PEZI|nr:uncharacterized protein CkaCkLH20_01367 [Colletotrichum karsti]KAF9881217.1 hypothetical protein CkaCkLH20_01367 [Colletotrichum karsti]
MASSDVLSQTLFTITNVKLDQLDKQKAAYESSKRALLDEAASEGNDRTRAQLFIEKAKTLPAMSKIGNGSLISIDNLKRFVQQSEYDPCISASFIRDCEKAVSQELDVESAKYRFAELYGKLVNEWISAGKSDDQNSESGFVPVGRQEMHEQRATWEGYVFHAKETDGDAIKEYLERLFCSSSKDVKRAFVDLRLDVVKFQKWWDEQTHFNEDSLGNTIRGLLRTDTLTDQKRTILNDFLNNKVVLREIADVLNMRMQTRQKWSWDGESTIDQRRQLNGRYRFYPDDDLLQSIFIHHIGTQWGVKMRSLLFAFTDRPGVEKSVATPMTKEDVRRRRYFLNMGGGAQIEYDDSVEKKLARHFKDEIFLDQLPQTADEKRGGYNGDDGLEDDSRKAHIAIVQNLLHLIQSEIIISQRLGNDMTVIRSDFKWFGPSVPHSSIFAVLEFFGVRPDWIDLFRRILECPLRFKQDPPDAPAQIRKRGTPLSTPLADFFAETMLFCMDFAVNQSGDGCRLYRLHDDMWLWGGQETCARAWRTMVEFAGITGLEFNESKTGSVRIGGEAGKSNSGGESEREAAVEGLPWGDVTWGFLKLDRASGRFLIDQSKIDAHIDELRLQLEACGSVFDWIQAWNIYGARFFGTNCGQLANCYSRAHVDSTLATFHRIQQRLFGRDGGGVARHLERVVAERFHMHVPDGYLYLPASLGGLGVQNPFIHLYLIREGVEEDPNEIMDKFLEEEEAEYRSFKARYEEADPVDFARRSSWGSVDCADLRDEPFMSFDEFTRHRRRTSAGLGRVLDKLRQLPEPKPIELTGDVEAALGSAPEGWYGLSGYEQWVCGLYAKDMISRFGSLVIVDKGLLPTGLLDMLRQSRFKWRG